MKGGKGKSKGTPSKQPTTKNDNNDFNERKVDEKSTITVGGVKSGQLIKRGKGKVANNLMGRKD
jgi:hypothetical protein